MNNRVCFTSMLSRKSRSNSRVRDPDTCGSKPALTELMDAYTTYPNDDYTLSFSLNAGSRLSSRNSNSRFSSNRNFEAGTNPLEQWLNQQAQQQAQRQAPPPQRRQIRKQIIPADINKQNLITNATKSQITGQEVFIKLSRNPSKELNKSPSGKSLKSFKSNGRNQQQGEDTIKWKFSQVDFSANCSKGRGDSVQFEPVKLPNIASNKSKESAWDYQPSYSREDTLNEDTLNDSKTAEKPQYGGILESVEKQINKRRRHVSAEDGNSSKFNIKNEFVCTQNISQVHDDVRASGQEPSMVHTSSEKAFVPKQVGEPIQVKQSIDEINDIQTSQVKFPENEDEGSGCIPVQSSIQQQLIPEKVSPDQNEVKSSKRSLLSISKPAKSITCEDVAQDQLQSAVKVKQNHKYNGFASFQKIKQSEHLVESATATQDNNYTSDKLKFTEGMTGSTNRVKGLNLSIGEENRKLKNSGGQDSKKLKITLSPNYQQTKQKQMQHSISVQNFIPRDIQQPPPTEQPAQKTTTIQASVKQSVGQSKASFQFNLDF